MILKCSERIRLMDIACDLKIEIDDITSSNPGMINSPGIESLKAIVQRLEDMINQDDAEKDE